MENIIAVFNNRNQAMQFASFLKRMGVGCKTISTPRELSVSCGLSVVFAYSNMVQANYVLKSSRFTAFGGFFKIVNNNVFKKYLPL